MSRNIAVEVSGKFACFTRPEFKAERVSYEVITPSAARGMLDSIYWHKGMIWRIDRIQVCNPIQFIDIGKTNEIDCKANLETIINSIIKTGDPGYIVAPQKRIQRNNLILKDVRYIIHAHVEMLVNETKQQNANTFAAIARRRIKKGQCFRTPVLGMSEYAAYFNPPSKAYKCPPELRGIYDLGEMLWDLDYENDMAPITYHAIMVNGVIIPKHQICRREKFYYD